MQEMGNKRNKGKQVAGWGIQYFQGYYENAQSIKQADIDFGHHLRTIKKGRD